MKQITLDLKTVEEILEALTPTGKNGNEADLYREAIENHINIAGHLEVGNNSAIKKDEFYAYALKTSGLFGARGTLLSVISSARAAGLIPPSPSTRRTLIETLRKAVADCKLENIETVDELVKASFPND